MCKQSVFTLRSSVRPQGKNCSCRQNEMKTKSVHWKREDDTVWKLCRAPIGMNCTSLLPCEQTRFLRTSFFWLFSTDIDVKFLKKQREEKSSLCVWVRLTLALFVSRIYAWFVIQSSVMRKSSQHHPRNEIFLFSSITSFSVLFFSFACSELSSKRRWKT